MQEKPLTRIEMAKFLSISLRTMDKLIARGMPFIEIGERKRFSPDEVLEWAANKQEGR